VAPEPPDPEPLKEIITGIMEKPNIEPADWAGLARETVTFGQALQQAGQPVVAGSIADGLDAVDRGESVDAGAADWESLREELLKLLEEPPPQDQEQQNEDQQDDQENESEDQQESSDQQNQDQNNQQENQQNQEQNPSDPQSQNQQGDQQDEPEQNQQEPNEPQNQEEEQESQGQEEDSTPEPQEDREMQKFGGDPSSAEGLPEDSELAAAMQELEQVRNQDSPARLFQILEGEPQPDSKTEKNW
jgi:Ca-activated chloride channel family protein